MADTPPMDGLVVNSNGQWSCPKCRRISGDAWTQCDGACPVAGSPHFIDGAQRHPVSDWQYEVANGDTMLGYREWLEHKVEMDSVVPY